MSTLDRYLDGSYDPSLYPFWHPKSRLYALYVGVLWQVMLGAAIYSYNVIFKHVTTHFGWTELQGSFVFGVELFMFASSMFLAAFLFQKRGWSARQVAGLGMFLVATGYTLSSVLGAEHFLSQLLGVGLIAGIGIGLAYSIPIKMALTWFPDMEGRATGLSVLGFGGGAGLWIIVMATPPLGLNWLLEPNAVAGINSTFLYAGIFITAALLVGLPWVKIAPAGYEPDGKEHLTSKFTAFSEAPLSQVWHTKQFSSLFLSFIANAGSGLMIIVIAIKYLNDALVAAGYSTDDASAISVTATLLLMAFNAIGRLAWGWVSDHLGVKKSLMLMTGLQAGTIALFPVLNGSAALLVILTAFAGFNFGGNFALYPLVTKRLFGIKNFLWNYSGMFMAYGIGGLSFPIVGGYCLGLIREGHAWAEYVTFFGASAGLLAGLLLVMSVKEDKEDIESQIAQKKSNLKAQVEAA